MITYIWEAWICGRNKKALSGSFLNTDDLHTVPQIFNLSRDEPKILKKFLRIKYINF